MHTDFWWGNPRGKIAFGRPRGRWETDIREVGCGGMNWIELA
jgi:hypothetical protein